MSIDLTSGVTSDVVTPTIEQRCQPSGEMNFPPVVDTARVGMPVGKNLPGEANSQSGSKRVATELVSQAVSLLKSHAQDVQRELEFNTDEALDRVIITVKDVQTEEVIRCIPPEDVVTMSRQLCRDGSSAIPKPRLDIMWLEN